MKVEVISREIIKPSTQTPDHLHNIQFSSLDHLATSNYVSILLFYSSDDNTQVKTSDQLKQSLSETLVHLYPVAGRIKDDALVYCNDEGVDFVQARVNCQLLEILDKVNIDELDQFLPCNSSVTPAELSTKALLAIQVNIFDCGGICLGICFSHKVGDGVSLATFINTWASVSRGADQLIPCMYFDLSSYFPVKDLPVMMHNSSELGAPPVPLPVPLPLPLPVPLPPKIVTRRFVFDASSIASLRAAFQSSEKLANVEHPTRVELVSALIWSRAMGVAPPEDKRTRAYAAMHAVNLRQRMIPPLSDRTFGNAARATISTFLTGEMEAEYTDLVRHVRDSIKKVDEKYVVELQSGNEGFINYFKEAKQQFSEVELVIFNFNSWCRFPFYEADFGWGTPVWVAITKIPSRNLVILVDTRPGDGIEAWVNMLEEDMLLLEHDHDFLSFVSSK